ncbi:MAG: ATP-binding protein [Rhodospirillales bacterium]|nr:ATP-binding protein [Rhodospirillales bacterium]
MTKRHENCTCAASRRTARCVCYIIPEFPRPALEALRQPLETGRTTVARANNHVTYPARVQLIAAMNPCRCGWLDDPGRACSRAPKCAADYQSRLSGPVLDRIDLSVDVPAVTPADLALPPPAERSADVAARVAAARDLQRARYAAGARPSGAGAAPPVRTNAEADGALLDQVATPDEAGRRLLVEAVDRMRLSARSYHRVLRVARTLADLDGSEAVRRIHVAEALSYRRPTLSPASARRSSSR